MVQVKKIEPPTVDLYAPDGTHLGLLNEYEFLDARVQIKKEQTFGYYIIFNDRKIRLDKNGTLEDHPVGLLDTMSDLWLHLI